MHFPGQARRDRPDHRRLCTRAEMTLDHGPSGNEAWPNSCPLKPWRRESRARAPTLSNVKSYFLGAMFYGLGAMFYGPFIVAMLLNVCAVVAGLDAALSRLTLKPELRRWLISGLHLLPLAVVLSIFVHNCLPGRVELATRLSQDEIHDIGAATEKVWSLLRQKSLMQDVEPSFRPGKVPVVSFSSPHPVTSTTIQLYAVRARMPLDVRGEYLNRTAEAAERALLASDVSIVTSSIPHNLPEPRMGDELIRRLDANPDMRLIASFHCFPRRRSASIAAAIPAAAAWRRTRTRSKWASG